MNNQSTRPATTTERTKKQTNDVIIAPISSSNTHNIRLYILKVLKQLPSCSTLEFKDLGVTALAPRVWDLRHKFHYNIITYRVDEYDSVGVLHKGMARYVLKHSPDAEEIK